MQVPEQEFIVDYLRTHNKKFKEGADTGALKIIEYGIKNAYSLEEIAYALGTAEHETAGWMQPIREGATRYGTKYTNAQSVAAVTALYTARVITTNYALPNDHGVSYYGRGYVQITWSDNYKKYQDLTGKPLVANPDLALEHDVAAFVLYDGIRFGRFRSIKGVPVKFSDFVRGAADMSIAKLSAARSVVNGDVKKNGGTVAQAALRWYDVLVKHETALRTLYTPKPKSLFVLILDLLFALLKDKTWK